MKLSDGEKLIIYMLCELYEKLKVKGEIDPNFIRSALLGGNLWGIEWEHSGLFPKYEADPKTVEEVVDFLDMWSALESEYKKLPAKDKKRVKDEAHPFGADVKFRGFDGNHETDHMGVARFLIDDLGRFKSFKGRGLNCHSESLTTHRRMYKTFKPLREKIPDKGFGADDIIAILKG